MLQLINRLKRNNLALAGVTQWTEHWPVNQRVAGWIPSQGTCLGCGARSSAGNKRQPSDVSLHVNVSLPSFLPPFPSLKINKNKILKKKIKSLWEEGKKAIEP